MKSAETPNDRVVRAKFSSRGMATGLGAPSAMSTEEGVRMDFRAAGRVGWWLARAKRLVPLIGARPPSSETDRRPFGSMSIFDLARTF